MKKALSVFAVAASVLPFGAVGNVGVFRGSGASVQLCQTADIQMVEETVTMIPMRGNFPIDSSCQNQDKMKYYCVFKLRNLSDKTVTIPVGFPLSSEIFYGEEEVDQTEIIGRFGFVAGTTEKTFPVRYVPHDESKKFKHLFLWDMTFAPQEETELKVVYEMGGYLGLGETRRKQKENELRKTYTCRYLSSLEGGVAQGHVYVTGTGASWAKEIEKATFRIYSSQFEEYLHRRGAFESSKEDASEKGKKSRNVFFKEMTRVPVRYWEPAFDCWKKVSNGGRATCYELVYAPFKPKKDDRLSFYYIFPVMPQTAQEFDLLLETVIKENKKVQVSKEVERNVADVILEFYGIRTDNPAIRDFLENQCWYPVTEQREISAELKARLLK